MFFLLAILLYLHYCNFNNNKGIELMQTGKKIALRPTLCFLVCQTCGHLA